MEIKITPEMADAGLAAFIAGFDATVLHLNLDTIRQALCDAYIQMAAKGRERPEPARPQDYLAWAGLSLSPTRQRAIDHAMPDAVDLS